MTQQTKTRFRRVAAWSVIALAIIFTVVRLAGPLRRVHAPGTARTAGPAAPRAMAWRDSFGDGMPDFVRLTDAADQRAFRQWFVLLGADLVRRQREALPVEITDCASLLRYCYREALKRHDAGWLKDSGVAVAGLLPGEIEAWHYPESALGAGLFRVRPGAATDEDATNGAFAQFADAKTLVELNCFPLSRDVRAAQPGDLLFYRQFGQSSPWHSMIVASGGAEGEVIYHTGPDHTAHGPATAGEIRRVRLAELLDHPQPQWRPVQGNPNFLGVYRWKILRGNR